MSPVRQKIDCITTLILCRNPNVSKSYDAFKNILKKHDYEIKKLAKDYKISDEGNYLTADKIIADLYRRLGNKVIKNVLLLKKENHSAELKTKEKRNALRITKKKHYENKKSDFLLMECARLNIICEKESMAAFQEYLKKLREKEYEI